MPTDLMEALQPLIAEATYLHAAIEVNCDCPDEDQLKHHRDLVNAIYDIVGPLLDRLSHAGALSAMYYENGNGEECERYAWFEVDKVELGTRICFSGCMPIEVTDPPPEFLP